MNTIKLQDTDSNVGESSKLELYWKREGFHKFHNLFRNGLHTKLNFQTVSDLDKLVEKFKLNSIGFGNWVTQEDRYNYTSALAISLYDLNKVLGFKYNIGLNYRISITFGARGSGRALAHFEPGTFIINLTRYSADTSYSKLQRFAHTGGVGSFAHEYGHALDYYFGMFVEPAANPALSEGRYTRIQTPDPKTPIRKAMYDVLQAIILQGKDVSPYYKRLQNSFGGDYMFRRNEIFARAFESYVHYKLQKMNIHNTFLSESKYNPKAYLTHGELIKIEPKMDKLISLMRKKL